MFNTFISNGGKMKGIKVWDRDRNNPQKVIYDILVLYGETGNGKSTIARNFAEESRDKGRGVEIGVTTELIEDMLEYMKKDIGVFDFNCFIKNRYEEVDVIIFEDFHEIKNKDLTQMFMAEFVVRLAKESKQVVIVCTGEISDLVFFCEYLINHEYVIS